jgi:hypothetical protein
MQLHESSPRAPSVTCAFCGKLLEMQANHVNAWRSTTGLPYCSEFCADDEDETAFQDQRPA